MSQTEKASRKRSRGTEPLVARRRTARSTLTTRTRAVLPAQRTAPLQGFRQGRSSLWRSAVARPIWPPSWRLRASTTQGWPSLPKTATATSAAALRRLNTGRRRASQRTTKTRRLVLEPRRAAATCNETPTDKKEKKKFGPVNDYFGGLNARFASTKRLSWAQPNVCAKVEAKFFQTFPEENRSREGRSWSVSTTRIVWGNFFGVRRRIGGSRLEVLSFFFSPVILCTCSA